MTNVVGNHTIKANIMSNETIINASIVPTTQTIRANTSSVPSATTEQKGIARLATLEEVLDGLDNSTIVTPYCLKNAGVTVDQVYDATSANAQSGVAIAGAGFLTGINSTMVTTALGYTPYDSSNPNGYTTNTGTVTSVNNVSPVNGNVTISIPSEVTETTVSDWGFTKNIGTVTSVNNISPVNGNITLSIPAAQVNSDWNATSGVAEILNKPTIPTVDQTYSSTSTNAQSGVAINGELTSNYQPKLVSQSNIKAINNTSLLGTGSLWLVDMASTQTITGTKTFYSLTVNNPAASSSSTITLTNNGKTTYFGITYEGKTVIITPGVDTKFYYRNANDWLLAKSMLDSGLSYNTTTDKISVIVDSALSTTSTNPVRNSVVTTALNGKLDGFTLRFAGNWSGGVHAVNFITIDYSNCDSENGVFIKFSMVNSHGNGEAGRFLQDVVLNVKYTGTVAGTLYRYFAVPIDQAGSEYYGSHYYGDVFWVNDTANSIVYFYVLMHQYSYTTQSPYFRLNASTKGVITQYGSGAGAPEYSTGIRYWATINNFENIQSTTNLVTSVDSSSTDSQYPSAKCLYDLLGNVETLLSQV